MHSTSLAHGRHPEGPVRCPALGAHASGVKSAEIAGEYSRPYLWTGRAGFDSCTNAVEPAEEEESCTSAKKTACFGVVEA